jgi:hypothetical protein
MTTTTVRAEPRTAWQRIRYVAGRALHMEIGVWQSLYRFAFRRPKVPFAAAPFSYHKPVLAILIVILVVSAVELVAVDLIVNRWPYVRIPLLIVGIWGLTWMTGMLFGFLTRPHAVRPNGIRARYVTDVDIPLGWDEVDSVVRKKRTAERRSPPLTEDGGTVLHLRIQNETNIDIRLVRPVLAKIPQGNVELCEVRLYADEPEAFIREVRRYQS